MLALARSVKHGDDRTTRTALSAAGFSEEFVERCFRPFLSGVFLEDELETSSRVLRPAPRWPNPAREVARDLAAQSPVGG
ncbi:hypothetical protein ABZ504_03535 [Streptomyces mirabilis]